MRYKIHVRTIQDRCLVFNVDTYSIDEDGFIAFTDKVTGKLKKFYPSNCEIEVIQ